MYDLGDLGSVIEPAQSPPPSPGQSSRQRCRAQAGLPGDHRERLTFLNGIARTHKATSAVLFIQAEEPGWTPRPVTPVPVQTREVLIPGLVSSPWTLSRLPLDTVSRPRELFFNVGVSRVHFIGPLFLFLMLMRSRYRIVAFIFLRKYIASFLCKWHMCLELFGDQY